MKARAPEHHRQSARRFLAASMAVMENGWMARDRSEKSNLTGNAALRATSWRSLWSMQLFITISVAAFMVRDFNLYESLPENILQILGCPPPPMLAHCALAGYVLTVMIPLVIHLLDGEQPAAEWRQLGFRSAFYCFYLFSGTLASYFLLVFVTGMILYLLEQASICLALAKSGQGNGQPV